MLKTAFLFAGLASAQKQTDAGFEMLFQDSLDEVVNHPLTFEGTVPDYVVGDFWQNGPARWSWGDMKMTHGLDGYAKLNHVKFEKGGKATFTARFVGTRFYNESKEANKIVFAVLAQETVPPRKNPGPMGFTKAPGDNNYVNIFQYPDGAMSLASDTTTLVDIDHDMNFIGERNMSTFQQKNPMLEISAMGSGHPLRSKDGDYISLRETLKVAPIPLEKESFDVYRIRQNAPNVIEDIVKVPVKKASYEHSFGLALGDDAEYFVIAAQPIHVSTMDMMLKGTTQAAFKKADDKSYFHIGELSADAKIHTFEVPAFFYGHFTNTFSPAPGKVVVDINQQDDIFFDRYAMEVLVNKSWRDSWPAIDNDKDGKTPGYQTVTRYTFDLTTDTVTSAPLFGVPSKSNIFNEHDLFRLHPDDLGKPYCGYWAWQAFYNSTSFASWAVIRAEICGDRPTVPAAWYRPNVYPGEAQFVPKPGATDKTQGAIIFKTLDGNTGKSHVVIADAHTLQTIAEAELPVRVPFTVHGKMCPPCQMS